MVSVSSIANVNLKMLPILKSRLPLYATDSNEIITLVPLPFTVLHAQYDEWSLFNLLLLMFQ